VFLPLAGADGSGWNPPCPVQGGEPKNPACSTGGCPVAVGRLVGMNNSTKFVIVPFGITSAIFPYNGIKKTEA